MITRPRISIARTLKTTLRRLLAASLLAAVLTAGARAATDPALSPEAAATPLDQSQPASASPEPKSKANTITFDKVMGLTIALVSVVMGIGVAFFGIWYDYRKRRDLLTVCHQERMAALEKGLELPPFPPLLVYDVLCKDESPQPSAPGKGLKPGLIWLGIGIGLVIFLSAISPPNTGAASTHVHPAIGAIPIGIGIAYLLCHAIEGRSKKLQKPPQG